MASSPASAEGGVDTTGTAVSADRLRPWQRLGAPLPPFTNLRLRLRYPALDRESADIYGKVLAARQDGGACLLRIALTSVEPADEAVLKGLIGQA